MKYVALLVCLLAVSAFASPCPASGTLDSYISLGSTGCEDSHGTTLHDVTFTSATFSATDVTLILGLNGSGMRKAIFDFNGLDYTTDSFVISFLYLLPNSSEQQWSIFTTNNGVNFFPSGGSSHGTMQGDIFETFHFDASPTGGPGAVPEPASLVLLGSGLAAIARRRFYGTRKA